MSEERADWRAIGTEPVNAENPVGESVRYDPEFERLQAEMQKLESLSGDPINWKEVVALSKEILKNKSKDLLVGSYLILGLLETEGYNGLLNGLTCLEGAISAHWASLFPVAKRMRARVNALNWLSEKAGASISRRKPDQDDGVSLKICEELVKSLEDLLDEKISPEEPVLGDLYRSLQEQANRLPDTDADTDKTAEAPESKVAVQPAPAIPVAATKPATNIETSEDAKRSLKDAFGSLKKIAAFTRSQDLAQPMPYRLIRFLTWCEIDAPPPAENGKSRVPPPPKQLRDRFRTLSEQSAWQELVLQTEGKVAEFPFWLDLHRLSETALAELGPDYIKARTAIKSEVINLLDRLPDLMEIEFSDETPFADESTRNWISTQIFTEKEAKPVEVAASGDQTDFLTEVRTKSRQLLQDGDPKAALGLVQETSRTAPTERQKFLAQLELANLCLEIRNIKAALAQLEMLNDQITRFSLDIWEPQLASQVLQIYWHTINRALKETKQPAPELSRLADSVFGRLCRLDVLAGLNATKGK
ncbi:MAG: type VI secretion system protein TssA [Acidobacteria bacterium]|nr:type VI secretion system protein TssA [Acidobacteriota bacterium]